MRLHLLLVLCLCWVGACRKPTAEVPDPPGPETPIPRTAPYSAPKRLVLFIGDGMGVGQITAATYANGANLQLLEMPHLGFMTTHEYEFLTTDSAASATAISTGVKTSYEAVSVKAGTAEDVETDRTNHMQTLLELASSLGLRTGIVSTSRVNHATPAAFGAHRFHRHQYEQIAADFVDSGIDVLIGPGSQNFTQRTDGRNLLTEMGAAGWATATTVAELDAIDPAAHRVVALLHPKDYPFLIDDEPRAMSLEDMTSRAIDVLDRGQPAGWVLLVEGSFVDWCAHNLDGRCAAMEVLDLDDAVGRARAYAATRTDTLVVVTADHETGGMSVIDPYYAARFADILGGEDAATQLAAHPDVDGKPVDAPPPFQHLAIGKRDATPSPAPLANPKVLGMSELVDGRATLVMGHFSMASRPYWKSKGRFYATHTPTIVSIHAEGAGAPLAAAARDNADLGKALRDLITVGAASGGGRLPIADDTRPRNVVLMIGDGMGLPAITAAHYWSSGVHMLDLDVRGLVSTHATDYLVNDSAATATALATGVRTRKKSVGKVVRDGAFVSSDTVLEIAERRGIATGIVTTTPITHATPAAFFAHQDDRYQIEGIAKDLVTLATRAGVPEVLLGGGAQDFDAATRDALVAAGYSISTEWPPPPGDVHVLGLLADDGLAPAAQRNNDDDPSTPSLSAMTEFALQRLETSATGFFLLVEGGQIDWRLHEGKRDSSVLAEVMDFDDAVATVTRWAAARGDTLVIVTADHDHTLSVIDNHYGFESGRCGVATQCGGPLELFALPVNATGVPHTEGFANVDLQGTYAPPQMYLQYAWPIQEGIAIKETRTPHSANFVPLFASGPRAERLRGFRDQPEIGRLLTAWAHEAP